MQTEVISFYSDIDGKTYYSDHAKRLSQQLDALRIPYDIQEKPSLGTYQKNCLSKPQYIYKMLVEKQRPIIWLDIDSDVRKSLNIFDNFEGNTDLAVACSTTKLHAAKASPIYLAFNSKTLEFLQHWNSMARQMMNNGQWFDHEALIGILHQFYQKDGFRMKFVVRSGKSKEDGTGFAKLYLDGELVETSFFFDDPKKCWGEKEMKGIWKHNFGEEQIEETRKKDGLTTWSGQNGGLASFGVLKGKNGGETGFALLSSAKMKVVRDKYYQAELAKIPAPKPKEKDDGPKITFGGKKRDRGTGQLRVVGGSVYDGPEYIGYTSGDYIYINK